jgi:hypothetical protein
MAKENLERFEGKAVHRFSVSKRALKNLGRPSESNRKQDALVWNHRPDHRGHILILHAALFSNSYGTTQLNLTKIPN